MVQDFARDAARIITCKFANFFARIGARLCKNRARKGTYRVHVPSKSCMQDSCTILHDLASSFLLGMLFSVMAMPFALEDMQIVYSLDP